MSKAKLVFATLGTLMTGVVRSGEDLVFTYREKEVTREKEVLPAGWALQWTQSETPIKVGSVYDTQRIEVLKIGLGVAMAVTGIVMAITATKG